MDKKVKQRSCPHVQHKEVFLKLLEDTLGASNNESDITDDNLEIFERFYNLQKKFEDLEREKEVLKEELDTQMSRSCILESKNKKLISENLRLKDEIILLNEEISHLTLELSNFEKLQKDLKIIKENLMEKQNALNEKDERIAILQRELNDRENQNLVNKAEEELKNFCQSFLRLNDKIISQEMGKIDDDVFVSLNEELFDKSLDLNARNSKRVLFSTKKSLQSDLSRVWSQFQNEEEEESDMVTPSNYFDNFNSNFISKEDSGLDLSAISSDQVENIDSDASHKLSSLLSPEILENPGLNSSDKDENPTTVEEEMRKAEVQFKLEEIEQEINSLEVRFEFYHWLQLTLFSFCHMSY